MGLRRAAPPTIFVCRAYELHVLQLVSTLNEQLWIQRPWLFRILNISPRKVPHKNTRAVHHKESLQRGCLLFCIYHAERSKSLTFSRMYKSRSSALDNPPIIATLTAVPFAVTNSSSSGSRAKASLQVKPAKNNNGIVSVCRPIAYRARSRSHRRRFVPDPPFCKPEAPARTALMAVTFFYGSPYL